MITKSKTLFCELYPNNKKIFLKRCKSDINLHKIEHENIYKELYIIIHYLRENKEIIKNQKEKESIIYNFLILLKKMNT